MTLKEFVKNTITVPLEETEPFCPFEMAYCNYAYSDTCYNCELASRRYEYLNSLKRPMIIHVN